MIDLTQLDNAIASAWDRMTDELGEEMQAQMRDKKWEWDGVTRRANGEIVASPRDIIDTQRLYDSFEMEKQGDHVNYSYHTPYAAINHEGGIMSNGGIMQPRPWVEEAVREYDPLNSFADILRESL